MNIFDELDTRLTKLERNHAQTKEALKGGVVTPKEFDDKFTRTVKGHREKLEKDLAELHITQRDAGKKAHKQNTDAIADIKRSLTTIFKRLDALEATSKQSVMAKASAPQRGKPKDLLAAAGKRVKEIKTTASTLRVRADKAIKDPKLFGVVDGHISAGNLGTAKTIIEKAEAKR